MAAPWAAPVENIEAPSVGAGSGKGSGTENSANESELATVMLKRRSNATVLITASSVTKWIIITALSGIGAYYLSDLASLLSSLTECFEVDAANHGAPTVACKPGSGKLEPPWHYHSSAHERLSSSLPPFTS